MDIEAAIAEIYANQTALAQNQENILKNQERIAASIASLHRRLCLQEAGMALYEVANGETKGAH